MVFNFYHLKWTNNILKIFTVSTTLCNWKNSNITDLSYYHCLILLSQPVFQWCSLLEKNYNSYVSPCKTHEETERAPTWATLQVDQKTLYPIYIWLQGNWLESGCFQLCLMSSWCSWWVYPELFCRGSLSPLSLSPFFFFFSYNTYLSKFPFAPLSSASPTSPRSTAPSFPFQKEFNFQWDHLDIP